MWHTPFGRSVVPEAQSRGLSEGYSDYFAASILDDPRFGDYIADKAQGERNCATAGLRFPPGLSGNRYVTGAVWASILWSIRAAAGAKCADRLAIESLEFLHRSSTFEEARTALNHADQRLFGGRHRDLIDREFEARLPL